MLTDVAIKAEKPGTQPRKVADGGGLHLLINPNGNKLWRFSYRFGGKQKTMAMGVYPATSLKEARDIRLTGSTTGARFSQVKVSRGMSNQTLGAVWSQAQNTLAQTVWLGVQVLPGPPRSQ